MVIKATLEHLDSIIELHNLAHPKDPWSRERFQEIFDYDVPIMLVQDDEKIVGLLIYLVCLDEVKVINLAIHPDYRQRNYAQQLLYTMFREAQENNLRYIMLNVRKSNFPAISLYTKLGFHILGVRKEFYDIDEHIEDSYLMQFEIHQLTHKNYSSYHNVELVANLQ